MHELEIEKNKLKDEIFDLNKDPNKIFVQGLLNKAIKNEEDEDSFDKIVEKTRQWLARMKMRLEKSFLGTSKNHDLRNI